MECVVNCKICNSTETKIAYHGRIRDGGVGKLTKHDVSMFQCLKCGTIWHSESKQDYDIYYQSEEYRLALENTSSIEDFYKLHDEETLQKLNYTTTTIFRDKIVADIGCGGGAFLDFVTGAARQTIGIEPSIRYRKAMEEKGYVTFPYMQDAKEQYKNRVEVITSFDVIEHVTDPNQFMQDSYDLLSMNGKIIMGTPTETPIMRELLGSVYEEFLFSEQHLWIFTRQSLEIMAEQAGFRNVRVEYKQRYDLANCLAWLIKKEPKGHLSYDFLSETMNQVWKNECNAKGLGDYIVLYAEK